ncbi:hypothetical protein EDB81DRAFT_658571 [Dactylonectria macrodidyma]|uniref:NAD-dependent epimerase/dehydratase domain-containing protein n=1 Tax=Dactylonectria macrodidyma TaxID=307937 RepID=A0A9P9EAV4_9HYPO|nr:hypothetical protein EDB81DRAFT_658571 [Dactylonectria macrodidyma]
MAHLKDLAIPKGSTVLVTGANGFLGSHTVDQFLHHGYRVRGTVRDPVRDAWLTTLFDGKYGKERFELVKVSDMAVDGAFDEVAKGVSAIAHTATVVIFDPNPHNVVPATISGAVNALKAAYAEPSVRRFVLTSSATAALFPSPDQPGEIVTEESWNENAVKQAWAEPPYTPERSLAVYAASKTQAEQEVWKFHRENQHKRPDLAVNTILPNMIFGKSLDVKNQGYPSSAGYLAALWKGEVSIIHHLIAPQYFVDVQDCARLHVAGVILPDVRGERIFGFAGRFSWDAVLEILRKHEPEKDFPDDFSGREDYTDIKPRTRAEEILRNLGQRGWTELEDTVLMNTEGLRATA